MFRAFDGLSQETLTALSETGYGPGLNFTEARDIAREERDVIDFSSRIDAELEEDI